MKVGILSLGVYIPRYRIKAYSIAKVWGKPQDGAAGQFEIEEKSVACWDEDSMTMALEACRDCFARLRSAGIKEDVLKKGIRRVFFGSESPVYAVNPTSTIIAEFLGMEENYLAYDTQFACRAGTGALISGFDFVRKNQGYALITASDKAQSSPQDVLEYSAGSGAVALIAGTGEDFLFEVEDCYSISSDTPDFWRTEGARYPSHFGRFTGAPAYFRHVVSAGKTIMKKNNISPSEFEFLVLHMPNLKFPLRAAKMLGFTKKQIEPSLLVRQIGNCYSASALLGLASVLEKAKGGERILLVSYGSGAGSDAFILKVGRRVKKLRPKISDLLKRRKEISYTKYLRFTHQL